MPSTYIRPRLRRQAVEELDYAVKHILQRLSLDVGEYSKKITINDILESLVENQDVLKLLVIEIILKKTVKLKEKKNREKI